MHEGHIERCDRRITEEEALARRANFPDSALALAQAAIALEEPMLGRGRVSNRARVASGGQMLAEIF